VCFITLDKAFTSVRAFDSSSGGLGLLGVAEVDAEGRVTLHDAHFLFHAEFKRTGSDLTLTGPDGQRVLIPDYFKHEKLPTLLSPEGAAISGELVEALSGSVAPGQYAQAGAPAAPEAIGRVATVQGGAVAVRNGVAVTLNAGDAVYKGGVVQTQGAGSALGVTLTDGTTFNLSANARMVLNEFVFSPASSQNSALINLVQGSIAFVAGEIARTGDMKVGTPVATMGIRGTAVSVEINANNGATKFSVMVEPNGRTGSFNLYENGPGGRLIGTVSLSGVGWEVTPAGPLQVLAQQFQKSADVLARELQLVAQVFNTQTIGIEIIQRAAPQQQTPQTDPNSKGTNGSGTFIIDQKTDKGSDLIKVVVTTVEKINTGEKKDAIEDVDTPPIIFIPPPPPVTVNPAALFLSGGTLTRLELVPAGGASPNLLAPDVSADGRFIAYWSASPLEGPSGAESTEYGGDVYLYDRLTGTTVTIATAGEGITYEGVSISLDSRYVVYQASVEEGQSTVFIYDRATGVSTELHEGGNAHVDGAGNFIVMEGQAGGGPDLDILVTDRDGDVVTAVSGNADIWSPEISADGRLITFSTAASEIKIDGQPLNDPDIVDDPDGPNQIYVYDRGTGDLVLVSVSTSGAGGNADSGVLGEEGDGGDWASSISVDGRYVVFQSNADDLVAGDNNGEFGATDIFIRDLVTGVTERISDREVHDGDYGFGTAKPPLQVNAVPDDDGDQRASHVTALADGGFLVTWDPPNGVSDAKSAQRYDVHGNKVGDEFKVNTEAVGADVDPVSAGLTDGGFVVVWTSASGIHGQMFTVGGFKAGGEFEIDTDEDAGHAAVTATADGGFFVTWTSTTENSGTDIHAQRYDSRGNAVGGEATINTLLTGDQDGSAISTLTGGGFVVVWQSPSPVPGAGTTVFAQRFDANGVQSGAQIEITKPNALNDATESDVTALVGGGFIVTWTAKGQGNDEKDVYVQRFSASGAAQAVTKVNTTTVGDQHDTTVAALPNGGYVVLWTTDREGDGTNIAGQQFNALGQKVGNEFTVNPPEGASAVDADATVLPNGDVVVTWTSQDGSGTGIFSRVYSDRDTVEANGASYRPQISPDGRYITFSSNASNLVGGDTNNVADTFIYDRVTGTIERVSIDSLGNQSFGPESLGNGVGGGGSVVAFGGPGIAFSSDASIALQADNRIKFAADGLSDLGGEDPLTLTAVVEHGRLSGLSGLTVVGGDDGSNGTLVVTGTLAALSAAVKSGLFYTPTGAGNDTLTITITDAGDGTLTRTIEFKPTAEVVSDVTNGSNIFIVDRSTGRAGAVLDDPAALTLEGQDLVFEETNTASFWIDQTRADPQSGSPNLGQVGEVFTVPDDQGELNAVTIKLSSPGTVAGGASFVQIKIYKWDGAPVGPAIFTSEKLLLPAAGQPLTPATFGLDLAVEAGEQYVLEIIGDGRIGLATAAANASGALFTQTGTDAWQQATVQQVAVSLGGDTEDPVFDFEPALTTAGTLPFTDTGDTHTVSVADVGSTWGALNAWIGADTTGGNTAGEVKWSYAVDPELAARLALGEVHVDTFTVTLKDSAGNVTSTTVSVTVMGTNERPNITSAAAMSVIKCFETDGGVNYRSDRLI
jgi:VCBS repeat-containing protein